MVDSHRYLLGQPVSLRTLASAALGNRIALQAEKLTPLIVEIRRHDEKHAEDMLTRQIESIRDWLDCNVPRSLVDKLADTAIQGLSYLCNKPYSKTEKYIAGRMAETFFINKVNYLLFYDSYFVTSSYSKSHKLTALTRLTLTIDSEKESIIFLQGLQNLKYLSLYSFTLSDDKINNIIRCAAENCPLIEGLDLSHVRSDLKDDIIDILTQIRKLNVIKFSRQACISIMGMLKLLLTCNYIKYISYDGKQYVIGDLFNLFASSPVKIHATYIFNLVACNVGSWYHLSLVALLCPFIQHITVDCYSRVNNLRDLAYLTDLRKLTLNKHAFYNDAINDLLKIIGPRLDHLELCRVNEIDLNALKYISKVCPYLQSLTLIKCNTQRELSMVGEMAVSQESENCVQTRIPPFNNLQNLTVLDERIISLQEETIRIELLFFLFSSCMNVEFVKFSCKFLLPGNFLLFVLDKNPMSRLKLLEVGRSTHITKLVIERLIQNCVTPPTVRYYF